jgi:hypothetical protein
MSKIIDRCDVYSMSRHKQYIKECCEYVSEVYCNSIYLFGGSSCYLSWDCLYLTPEKEDLILKTINGMCETKFSFKE